MLRALLFLIVAAFMSFSSRGLAQPAGPSEARRAELNAMYKQARSLQDESRYADALPLFQQVASELNSPNAMLEAGRCLHKMGRNVEAYETMQATERLAIDRAKTESRYTPVIDAAREELAAIEKEVGRLTVSVAPSGTLEVNGKARIPGETVVVAPGVAHVAVQAQGFAPVRRDVEVPAGAHKEVLIELVPAVASPVPSPQPAPPSPPRTSPEPAAPPPTVSRGGGARIAGYAVLGLGVGGWVTLIVGGVVSDNKFASVQSRCGDGPCTTEADQDLIDEGRTFELAANIGIVVGAVGTVAGTLLVIFGGPTEEPAPPPVAFGVYPGGGFLAYTGAF